MTVTATSPPDPRSSSLQGGDVAFCSKPPAQQSSLFSLPPKKIGPGAFPISATRHRLSIRARIWSTRYRVMAGFVRSSVRQKNLPASNPTKHYYATTGA